MAWGVCLLVFALIMALAVAYFARRVLAREALVGWLEARGIEAEASFEALGPRGLTGGLRIGPAGAPVLTAERAELSYRITGPWRGRALGVELERIELFEPTIHVRWTPEGPSLGDLDPLIAEFRSRPSQPDAPSPDIVVHNGLLQLEHAGGQAVIHADARMAKGVLISLTGRLEPTRLSLDDLVLDLGEARLGLVTRDGRTSASLAAALKSGRLGDVAVGSGAVSLALNAAYPEAQAPLATGPITLVVSANTSSLRQGETRVERLSLSGSFKGDAAGDLPRLTLRGRGALRAEAASGQASEVRFGTLQGSAQSDDLVWRRGPNGEVTGGVRVSLEGKGIETGQLDVTQLALDLSGSVRHGAGVRSADLTGAMSLVGGWSGLGAVKTGDVETVASLKRAARAFRLSAPEASLTYGPSGLQVGLPRPAEIISDSGGRLVVTARNRAPVYASGAGAFDLSADGGGLPKIDAQVASYRANSQGVSAQTRLAVATDFGPLEGVEAEAAGRFAFAGPRLAFHASGCAPVRLERFEAGATSVEAISLRLCPGSQPLLIAEGGQWRIQGRAEAVAAAAPFLQAELLDGGADLVFGVRSGDLFTDVQVMGGRLMDAADSPRFNPLEVTGQVRLQQHVWRGDLRLASSGEQVAQVELNHDGEVGVGDVNVDTGRLVFAEDGLQPSDLSPLAEAIGSPAVGAARFVGGFQWNPEGAVSAGRLSVLGLDFNSPAGPIRGLAGEIEFTSLTPLETAPGQQLAATQLQLLAPLDAPRLTFQLLGQSLEVSGGAVDVGGGVIRLEAMSIPFDPGQSWRGELVIDGVQLSDIVSATPFADRFALSARVSGRLPFIAGPDGFRFVQGRLEAIEPGRLSIRRAALTDVNASGGGASAAVDGLGEAAPIEETNTAVEFAYQAMEHLAFDLLDAEVNSLPGGRLGVLFHIRGEHSPPQRQEIRLTLGELIRRDFLNKELPLPSGTKVDLTLDTTLNLDQLLADYAQAQAAGGSGEVQTPEPQ
ncbi:MAG: YdbH domain-containing protein [Phenylobacterium sp.]|nr:YdbH domain-containing protein [Phenylobacterium sp.]